MKQAVMTEPGHIEFRDVAAPMPGPGEALLRIHRIGVCGSDIHVWHGKHPYTPYPVVQGHEFSACIEQIGEGVTGLAPGDKVTALPQEVCGTCGPCRRGDYHICDQLKVEGFQAPGCAQELWVAPADRIVKLPPSFSYEQGALVEPAAVAVHAVGRGGDMAGQNVVVLGAGPIGNLVAQVAAAGRANVLITDLSDYRLDVAKRCGLAHVSNAGREPLADAVGRVFGEAGYGVAFECVGVEATMGPAIETIGKGGTIVVVGVFAEKARVDLGLVQDRELTLRGTLMYRRDDYERAVELIATGGIATDPLVTRHVAFEDYPAAYDFIERAGDKTLKVMIDLA